MKADVAHTIRGVDLTGWKTVAVEYGARTFDVRVPGHCRILEMKEVPPPADPRARIRASIHGPIGGRPLPEILRGKGKPVDQLTVCITTSDITRPVPYKGEAGILPPLLELLHQAGIRSENIALRVGTGSHRPSTREEKVAMFGADVVAQYKIDRKSTRLNSSHHSISYAVF